LVWQKAHNFTIIMDDSSDDEQFQVQLGVEQAIGALGILYDPLSALKKWPCVCLRETVCGGQVVANSCSKTWYKIDAVNRVRVLPDRPRKQSIEFLVRLVINPPFDLNGDLTLWTPICDVNELVVKMAIEGHVMVEGDTGGAKVVTYDQHGIYYEVEKVLAFKHNNVYVKWRNVDQPEWIHRSYLDESCDKDLQKLIQQKAQRRANKKAKKAMASAYMRLYEAHMAYFMHLENNMNSGDDSDSDEDNCIIIDDSDSTAS
jgi:hypothetical protein